jgi:pSer/pThr/pTyr-binding forkhead associated (FHA) protein
MTHAVAVRTALAQAISPAPATVWLPPPPLLPGDSGPVLIGRSRRCDFIVADPSVSRRHALLLRGDAGWTLYDLGSTNGTRVNGRSVGAGAHPLSPGDRLELGTASATFESE